MDGPTDAWTITPAEDARPGAPSLVLIHGLGCSRVVWNGVCQGLRGRFRQILPDLPGHGQAGASLYDPRRHRTLDGMAEFVAEVLDAAGLESGACLVGHSVGCNLAWRVALSRPRAVSHLVLVNPSPCFRNMPDYQGGFDHADLLALLDLLEVNPSGWTERLAVLVGGEPGPASALLVENFCAVHPDCLRHFAAATFLADDRELLPRIPQPSLLLCNTADALVPAAVVDVMAKSIPRVRTHLLPIAGHAAHITHPAAVARAIIDFLGPTADA